ncbi:MAG: methyltransferase domain-containing protein [Candidatus Methanoperedens sp.]|nr:methyltransferase domain-containing protein [Candidatus Methanoperedens sp.]CAG0985160.1 23S rRNA (uracil-C(5))-methyltransferase RlmCD [Methanosarcinales archaeon]
MTRDKHTIKFTKPILSNKEGLQLSTPEIVAKYIARRLKTDIIADLGCGIGGQVIFFARECKKVYAVERNPEKLEYAKENCRLYDVDNVEFILGDALSPEIKEKVSDADIIFSDPARPLSEKERSLENLEPSIPEIIKIYSDVTPELAFHAPPQMPPERIVLGCEREYLSLNGQLNRLTLYLGSLKSCDRSAVVLPGGERLGSLDAPGIRKSPICDYLYEPEPSVVKAKLLNELSHNLAKENKDVFFYKGDDRRTLLTSSTLIDSDFFKDSYRAIANTENDMTKLKEILKSQKAKNVVLRFDIDPKQYWEIRTRLEEGLAGTRTLHVFGFGNELIVCEKI